MVDIGDILLDFPSNTTELLIFRRIHIKIDKDINFVWASKKVSDDQEG